MYFAIAVLPDEYTGVWVGRQRKGIACNFPVHITIKGRFRIPDEISVDCIVKAVEEVFNLKSFQATLSGPHYIDSKIRWIECKNKLDGFASLNRLHQNCINKLDESLEIESFVPSTFELDGFRPHMTLDWEENGIFVPDKSKITEHIVVRVIIEKWAVLQYTDDARRRGVTTVFEKNLL